MGSCRASADEKEDGRNQEKNDAEFEAFKACGKFDECVIAKYHEYLDDSLMLWEALGPDGIQLPYRQPKTKNARCENTEAQETFNTLIGTIIKEHNVLALGAIMLGQSKTYLMHKAETYVELNWRDYE